MGKMKELLDRYMGTTLDANIYFPIEIEPQHIRVLLEEKDPDLKRVKSIIQQVQSPNGELPTEAIIHMYDTYDINGEQQYMQYVGMIKMETEECWQYWKNLVDEER